MDSDECDPDLLAEVLMQRRRNKVRLGRTLAWDEPYDEDEFPCPRCGEMRCTDTPDGCRDPNCP